MPSPGNAPLSRFHLVKGPVYRQASLGNAVVSFSTAEQDPVHIPSRPRILCSPVFACGCVRELFHLKPSWVGWWCHVDVRRELDAVDRPLKEGSSIADVDISTCHKTLGFF